MTARPPLAAAHPARTPLPAFPGETPVAGLGGAGLPTPCLILREDLVGAAVAGFREAFPSVAIHYAVKCNPDLALLRHLRELGCGFEIASHPELELLTSVGVDPADVLYSNPVRPRDHVSRSHRAGVWRYSVDSPREMAKLSQAAPGAHVYARLGTDFTASVVPSEGKFGVAKDEVLSLLLDAGRSGLTPYGIAFHVGSQMTDPRAWDAPVRDAAEIMERLAEKGIRISMLDIGGGFPARYDKAVPGILEFGRHITGLLDALPYPVQVVAEPGRALVAEAGVMVCRVIQVVRRGETWWAHTDLGVFNGMMEVLETAGALAYPISAERDGGPARRYNVTGPTCDSQDTFALGVELPAGLTEGDLLFVGSAGAYTTAYSSQFNGFPPPRTHLRRVRDLA
ncbi:type III PLP-dependent enzyme [Streptosporangium carneum]|uniref:ornithine decarboxylase n=1 Tax=Streptosporangium carneum TaxID=47481 RepID=A0A9W6IAA4_9ACTN|nr:type III PLP-dependent enzyme [Streptosporangium carneum]GLK13879.1 ornithine decarboxylase [Streptosporangium carneum]